MKKNRIFISYLLPWPIYLLVFLALTLSASALIEFFWVNANGLDFMHAHFNVGGGYGIITCIIAAASFLSIQLEGAQQLSQSLNATKIDEKSSYEPHLIAYQIHKRAAEIFSHERSQLFIIPGNCINSFSISSHKKNGAIFITQACLVKLNQDELLALLCREQAWAQIRANSFKPLWISLLHSLYFIFAHGQSMLCRFSLGPKDPRPWHAKHGHPVFIFGLLFLFLGLPNYLMGYLFEFFIPSKCTLEIDRIATRYCGSKDYMKNMLKKAAQYPYADYPKVACSFFHVAMMDMRFLSQVFFRLPTVAQRIRRIKKMKLPQLFEVSPVLK